MIKRESALAIVEKLADDQNTQVLIVEPNVHELPLPLAKRSNVKLVSVDEAIASCDVATFLVSHKEFSGIPDEVLMEKTVLDFTNARAKR